MDFAAKTKKKTPKRRFWTKQKQPNDILSVLGLDLVYTVKFTTLPSEVLSGFALRNSFRQSGIFDCISLVLS